MTLASWRSLHYCRVSMQRNLQVPIDEVSSEQKSHKPSCTVFVHLPVTKINGMLGDQSGFMLMSWRTRLPAHTRPSDPSSLQPTFAFTNMPVDVR